MPWVSCVGNGEMEAVILRGKKVVGMPLVCIAHTSKSVRDASGLC